jgi:hypothetical protein
MPLSAAARAYQVPLSTSTSRTISPLSVGGKTDQRFRGTARAPDIETPAPLSEFVGTDPSTLSATSTLRYLPKSTPLLHCFRGCAVQENARASAPTVVVWCPFRRREAPLAHSGRRNQSLWQSRLGDYHWPSLSATQQSSAHHSNDSGVDR